MYNIKDYNIYYNHSKINKSDGVVLYIRNDIQENTEIIEINRLKVINTKITLENNKLKQFIYFRLSIDHMTCQKRNFYLT